MQQTDNPTHTRRKVFGRRKGRNLSQHKEHLLESLLPRLRPALPDKNKELNTKSLFSNMTQPPEKLILEIGFGYGDTLAHLQSNHPDWGFVGCEPYLNGVANLLEAIEANDTSNIAIWPDDVFLMLPHLPSGQFDQIYILNPDPWHKKRHFKRRIVRQETLDIYARLLKPDGQLIMTTDVDSLAEWMVTEASNHKAFEWTAESKADWHTPPTINGEPWQATKYEQMGAKAGRIQTYLVFRKAQALIT